MALWPVHQVNPVKRVVAATYQSVSGTGGAAMDELETMTRQVLDGEEVEPQVYPHQIAFNLIPEIGSWKDDDYTSEEMKMVNETRKIMHAPEIAIAATCVRVPVFVSHSAAVFAELDEPDGAGGVPRGAEQGAGRRRAGRAESQRLPQPLGRGRQGPGLRRTHPPRPLAPQTASPSGPSATTCAKAPR